jgi:hypothetical protein
MDANASILRHFAAMRKLVISALLLAVASPARAGSADELGSYERYALESAISSRGLEIDPEPTGKRIGAIHVVNLDVFSKREGFLQLLNVFHRTTRESVIEREVLPRPGELWDQERIDETKRRLRDSLFTTLVVVVPVKAPKPGEVDVLVVTRDIWSLRLNSQFEYQEEQLTRLSLSVAENNLLGYRKHVAFVFDMDQGAFSLGPNYVDKNIAGSHLRLTSSWNLLFSRATREREGSSSSTSFSYPLWSLDQKWGASVVASHFDSTVRSFVGTGLRTYDNPDTDEVEAVPWQYRFRSVDLATSGFRSFGHKVKHQISFGHQLRIRRPSLIDDFNQDAPTTTAFIRDVFPRSERSSALVAGYSLFTPRYVVYRNVNSFDLAEDSRVGPDLSVNLGLAMKVIGSERNFATGSLSAGWTVSFGGDGFARIGAGTAGRFEDDRLIDRQLSLSTRAASPRISFFRIVGRAEWAGIFKGESNQAFIVGGDSGLRGYQIGAFRGLIRVRANLELRSMPVRVLFTRLGGLLFWDVGHAADSADELSLHHDVGFGARLLVPQLQPAVFRFDWAFPLNGPTAGLPGRFIAGVSQAF